MFLITFLLVRSTKSFPGHNFRVPVDLISIQQTVKNNALKIKYNEYRLLSIFITNLFSNFFVPALHKFGYIWNIQIIKIAQNKMQNVTEALNAASIFRKWRMLWVYAYNRISYNVLNLFYEKKLFNYWCQHSRWFLLPRQINSLFWTLFYSEKIGRT